MSGLQDQIEEYVAGRLGESEAEAFEAYCVEHPEVARQVEFEQRLRAGMAQVARGSTAEFVRSTNPVSPWLAVAATVLLVAGMGYVGWRSWGWHGADTVLTALTEHTARDVPVLRFAQVRGASDNTTLRDEVVRVEVVGLFDVHFHYSIELSRLQGGNHENVATLYGQSPSSPVTLEVMLDGERLRPGAYLLRVRKQAADEEPVEFSFVKS